MSVFVPVEESLITADKTLTVSVPKAKLPVLLVKDSLACSIVQRFSPRFAQSKNKIFKDRLAEVN